MARALRKGLAGLVLGALSVLPLYSGCSQEQKNPVIEAYESVSHPKDSLTVFLGSKDVFRGLPPHYFESGLYERNKDYLEGLLRGSSDAQIRRSLENVRSAIDYIHQKGGRSEISNFDSYSEIGRSIYYGPGEPYASQVFVLPYGVGDIKSARDSIRKYMEFEFESKNPQLKYSPERIKFLK